MKNIKLFINRFRKSYLYRVLKYLFVVISIAAIVFSAYTLFSKDEKEYEPVFKEYYYEDYRKFKNHADDLVVFYQDNWSNATKEEKIEGAKQATYTAAGCLSLPGKFSLDISDLKNRVAEFDYNKRIIRIDPSFIYSSTAYDVFTCIFHEVYKIYEWDCIAAYATTGPSYKRLDMFSTARKYDNELKQNGQLSDCPYEHSYYKSMEEDAQSATKKFVDSFFKFIGNWQFKEKLSEIDNEYFEDSLWN